MEAYYRARKERARYLSCWETRKVCTVLTQNRHFRQLETFLCLSLDGVQFRHEAGASELMNELQ